MADEQNFFAAPPSEEEAAAGEAPIILGGAPDEYEAPPAEDQAAFVGDVNEVTDDAPIVLGPTGSEEEIAIAPAVVEDTGPSPMQQWNEEWQETLKTRKDAENARKAELLEEARVGLEAFQAEREQKREAKMVKNREDEQEKLEAIEADLENDNSWQRVCKMVELSHDSTKQAQDVKRMRDVLIYLKNEPTKAEALA